MQLQLRTISRFDFELFRVPLSYIYQYRQIYIKTAKIETRDMSLG